MWRPIISLTLISVLFELSRSSQQTCSECFQDNGLEWCSNNQELNTSFYTRCLVNNKQADKWREWCGSEFVYHPTNEVNVVEDEPYTNPETVNNREKIIQIKPQLVEMKLTPGKSETLDITFKFVRGYFLELYYLMDMSKSMEQDKETIIRLADDLATELQKLTPNLKLGFGSFLDKVMLPYVNTHSSWLQNPCNEIQEEKSCREPYGYQNILSLTNDTEEFIESVKNAKLSTNWDDPEGGLDALIQAMVCKDIGWQTTTTRHLIVYVSGSAFKYAGDGKLAGLTKQNDLKCHLDEEGNYVFSSLQDYPSVSQIEHISSSKRMHLIFAVKENVLPLYKALSDIIIQSEASELREDSSNIIDIVTSIYEDISRTLILTDDSYKTPQLTLSYASKCGRNEDFIEGLSQCEDVDINEEINFRINFKLTKCLEKNEEATVKIFPQGLEDELRVKITSNCECDCETDLTAVQNSVACAFHGMLACGVCMCNEGYEGKNCECEDLVDSIQSETEVCKAPGDQSGKDCSGHGICKCGICECQKEVDGNQNWKYQGEFCECSNFDCPKSSGFLCSNHGRCDCTKCICDQGWTGAACSCDTRQNKCLNPVTQKQCSGHGLCECNECRCSPLENDKTKKYFGKFCEDCESCEGLCSIYNDCINCKIYEKGPLVENCDNKCSGLKIVQVDNLEVKENEKRCSYKNDKGCLVIFAYAPTMENVVFVQKEPNCSEKVTMYVVIGSMVALIFIIGILILVLWKCWVTLKDKREYKKFLREYEQTNFTQQLNPIYKDPITRVNNPMRGVEE